MESIDDPADDVEKTGYLCDCDPKYKDTKIIQKSRGGTIGPIGGQQGAGTTVIVCRSCGRRFYEDDGENGADHSVL